MKKKYLKRNYIAIAAVSAVLLIAVLLLMNQVRSLLHSDVKINIMEIVTQNKDVITSKLMLEVNNLGLVSKQISERASFKKKAEAEDFKNTFLDYTKNGTDEGFVFSDAQGNAVSGDGTEINIRGRKYFRLAMEGKENISERVVSRLNGEDVFIISVPVYAGDEIVGTIQKQYKEKEMYGICSISLFSQQGAMYIINKEGYVLIDSKLEDGYAKENSNYFRMLYLDNPQVSKRLEADIAAEREGFFEVNFQGEKIFAAYTPIEEVHEWYLITSVNTAAVMPNATIVIQIFYVILLVVLLFFSVMMLYYATMKNKQRLALETTAFVDTVTGGNTYTKFLVEARRLLQQGGKSPGIFVMDIDNFKYINSFYGFDKGDDILKNVYTRYSDKLKPGECLARNSADHFIAFLQDSGKERLLRFFESEMDISGVKVYFSAGFYPISSTEESLNLMIDKATMASQKTKGKKHKNVGVYSSKYDEEIVKNERIKREVEQAVANGEIVPYFQPKINVHTGGLVGAEALARWITPQGKLIPPNDFIPVCEFTGVIDMVDWTIFDKTLAFIRRHLDAGVEGVPVSVNFSRMHLINSGFADMLRDKLEASGVPPRLIEVEMTETIIYDNVENINLFIETLHGIGVRVSMDDFGSGYSSLHMLKDVDIDVLKIDRGFLNEASDSKKQQVIFEAIAQMARQLDIEVVVEGVETAENVALMKQAKCDVAQGYFYSRPVEMQKFDTIYREGHV